MKKNLFAILFLVFMAVMGGASVAGYVKTHPKVGIPNDEGVSIVLSFAEQYPFPEKENTTNNNRQLNIVNLYNSTAEYIVETTKSYTCSSNIFSSFFTNPLCNLYKYDQGDIVLNGSSPFICLKDGYFTFLYPYSHPVDLWESQRNFVSWLDARDVNYLSLITADMGDDTYSDFPEGIPHGYTRMADEYTAFLEENNIEYLESRDKLIAHDSNFSHWFYKADHHWNVRAGFLIANETAKRLNEMNIKADTSIIRKENFTLTVYPNGFLGSLGRKLGPAYKEDMEIYYPNDTSLFHLQIPNRGIDRTDCFANTLISKQYLSSIDLAYGAFLNSAPALVRIENMLVDNTTRVLVLKESKGNVFCPYFAFTVRYLDVIDHRHFDGSIRTFIEKTKPDIVITCVDVPYDGNEEFWILK